MPYANIEDRRVHGRTYHAKWVKANHEKWRRYRHSHQLKNPEKYLLANAKMRAKKKGLVFEIDVSDIIIPETCPILGIPLFFKPLTNKRHTTPNSPSLDRITNSLGYVKGNVQVISWRANSLKKDATAEELRLVADFVTKQSW